MSLVKRKEMREAIVALDRVMQGMEKVELAPGHHFAGGIYARELFVPAGTLAVSKIHKTEHFTLILTGKVTVVQEDGRKDITAPYLSVTKPGTKRAVYAHEDSIWMTFHATDKTDLDEIEDDIIAKDFDDADLKLLMRDMA